MEHFHGSPEATSPDARLLYPVEAAARRIGVGRTTLYGLINDGSLPSVQIGRRRLVAEADLLDFVARLRSGGCVTSSPGASSIGEHDG